MRWTDDRGSFIGGRTDKNWRVPHSLLSHTDQRWRRRILRDSGQPQGQPVVPSCTPTARAPRQYRRSRAARPCSRGCCHLFRELSVHPAWKKALIAHLFELACDTSIWHWSFMSVFLLRVCIADSSFSPSRHRYAWNHAMDKSTAPPCTLHQLPPSLYVTPFPTLPLCPVCLACLTQLLLSFVYCVCFTGDRPIGRDDKAAKLREP
jgi:hypothetical protein